ncbi:MAG TPA: transcriptional regulator [Parvularcula sp.]|nr:transcriptional regulator [Parvularcula sp.]HBS34863.1 transcriptional regulator [Parvularcula sp.]
MGRIDHKPQHLRSGDDGEALSRKLARLDCSRCAGDRAFLGKGPRADGSALRRVPPHVGGRIFQLAPDLPSAEGRSLIRRGFVLGKFLPPHAGHRFLVETALAMTDETFVLVCSTDAAPIRGALRFDWMRKMSPGAGVIHLHRDLPQAPEDHPDFWEIWRTAILNALPAPPTHVFASEHYVFRLAEALGAVPVLVDPERKAIPVSGSALYEAPHAHWAHLPREVRPFFQKRLTFLGPESTGKTTISAALADSFQTRAMPEYGRTYDVAYKQGRNWHSEDLVTLAETHRAMREAIQSLAGPLLIEDTDAVQTAVWSEFLVGAVAPALEKIERETLADHYLILAPDIAWAQDGVRYAGDPATRAFFFDEAERRLKRLGARYDIISGEDFDFRRCRAIEAAQQRFDFMRD